MDNKKKFMITKLHGSMHDLSGCAEEQITTGS